MDFRDQASGTPGGVVDAGSGGAAACGATGDTRAGRAPARHEDDERRRDEHPHEEDARRVGVEPGPRAPQRVGVRQQVDERRHPVPQRHHLGCDDLVRGERRRGRDDQEPDREPLLEARERLEPVEEEDEDEQERGRSVGPEVERVEERGVHRPPDVVRGGGLQDEARPDGEERECAAPRPGDEERGRPNDDRARPPLEAHGAATHSGSTAAGRAPTAWPRARKRRTARLPLSP